MFSISDMKTIKYWKNLGTSMDTEKGSIPKQHIIGDTCFYSIGNYWRGFIHEMSKEY